MLTFLWFNFLDIFSILTHINSIDLLNYDLRSFHKNLFSLLLNIISSGSKKKSILLTPDLLVVMASCIICFPSTISFNAFDLLWHRFQHQCVYVTWDACLYRTWITVQELFVSSNSNIYKSIVIHLFFSSLLFFSLSSSICCHPVAHRERHTQRNICRVI